MHYPPRQSLVLIAIACGVALAVFGVYYPLPARPFAADDFEWLLNVRDLSFASLMARAFDSGVESHFYRPMVWLALWTQVQAFGVDARGFHLVSLALHSLNALLAGALIRQMAVSPAEVQEFPYRGVVLGALFVALHPAPFEAVVWVSAQSELLAATWILLALLLWGNGVGWWRAPAATVALALALLTKESAVAGLPLLFLCEWRAARQARRRPAFAALALPLLALVAYLVVALDVAARNYLVRADGYGLGPQMLLNPFRALGLLVAPLPGVEDGGAPWLPLVGALALAAWGLAWRRGAFSPYWLAGLLAVAITLLPTAPFASPPDSRYLYPAALVLAVLLGRWASTDHAALLGALDARRRQGLVVAAIVLALLAAFELQGREARFAAGARPGEELRLLAVATCATDQLNRMLIVEPPLAAPHALAIVRLSCGERPRPIVVGQDEVERELRTNTLVVVFNGGVPSIVLRTPPPQ